MTHELTSTGWDDAVDELITGDLTGALGYRTPAGGVVVQAVAPIGLRDGRVCMAFHAREHGTALGGLLGTAGALALLHRRTEAPTSREQPPSTTAPQHVGA